MARNTKQLDLTPDEIRRLLYSFRMSGQELHRPRLEDELEIFKAHIDQFGPKHVSRSLADKLLVAAEAALASK